MEEAQAVKDFSIKFGKLTEQNQRYIMAIQQALLYTQDSEKTEKQNQKKEDDKQ